MIDLEGNLIRIEENAHLRLQSTMVSQLMSTLASYLQQTSLSTNQTSIYQSEPVSNAPANLDKDLEFKDRNPPGRVLLERLWPQLDQF